MRVSDPIVERRGTALEEVLDEMASLDRLRRLAAGLRSDEIAGGTGCAVEFLRWSIAGRPGARDYVGKETASTISPLPKDASERSPGWRRCLPGRGPAFKRLRSPVWRSSRLRALQQDLEVGSRRAMRL